LISSGSKWSHSLFFYLITKWKDILIDTTIVGQKDSENDDAGLVFQQAKKRMADEIIAQDVLIERLRIAFLADGHLLVEGVPGLAKTCAVKSLADCIEGDSLRLQFTKALCS
jgi:hypothetical protein